MYDVATVFTGVYLVIYAISMALSIAFYVLQSLGYHTLAKRRGIANPWLAWLPIGNAYIMGAVADDYNIKARNVKTNYRKILLYLLIAVFALAVMLYPILFVGVFSAIEADSAELGLGVLFTVIIISILLLAVAVTACVFEYISIYRILQSCTPKNAIVYFLLGIFISGTLPFFIFFLRNKDEGMPFTQTQFTQGA